MGNYKLLVWFRIIAGGSSTARKLKALSRRNDTPPTYVDLMRSTFYSREQACETISAKVRVKTGQ